MAILQLSDSVVKPQINAISNKGGKEWKYSEIVQSLIKESKGIVTGTTSFGAFTSETEKVMPHRALGQPLNWKIYSDVYNNVGAVKNAINNTVNFSIQSGYELEGGNTSTVEKWIDEVNFNNLFSNILKQTLIYGNAYIEVESLKLLPVDQMFVKVSTNKNEDGKITGYIQKAGSGQNIEFDKEEIIHFMWNDIGTSFYGIPDIRAALGTIRRLLQYQEDIGEIIHRYGHPILHWVAGTDDTPGTQTQIDALIEQLNTRKVGEDLVTSFGITAENHQKDLRMMQVDGLIKQLENELIGALEVPDFFIRGGETSNKSTAETSLVAFDRKVKALRDTQGEIIEDRIFKELLKTDTKFAWKELSVQGEETKSNIVNNLASAGVPIDIALQMASWGNYSDDVKSRKEEEAEKMQDMLNQIPQKSENPQEPDKKKPEEEDYTPKYYKAKL